MHLEVSVETENLEKPYFNARLTEGDKSISYVVEQEEGKETFRAVSTSSDGKVTTSTGLKVSEARAAISEGMHIIKDDIHQQVHVEGFDALDVAADADQAEQDIISQLPPFLQELVKSGIATIRKVEPTTPDAEQKYGKNPYGNGYQR